MRTYNLFPLIGLSLLVALMFFLMSCSKKTEVDISAETTTPAGDVADTNTVYITRDTYIQQTTPPATGSTMNAQDQQFVAQALPANKGEVELGRLALTKASALHVKDFAQMMVDDHSKAFNELLALASAKQLAIDTATTTEQTLVKKKLMSLSGKTFDKEYIRIMVSDHEKARDRFQLEISGGGDQEIRAFAGKYLPAITTHLQQARAMDTVTLSAVR